MILWRVTCPDVYVAGLEIEGGRVVRAAPILRWSEGWTVTRLSRYLQSRGLQIEVLQP